MDAGSLRTGTTTPRGRALRLGSTSRVAVANYRPMSALTWSALAIVVWTVGTAGRKAIRSMRAKEPYLIRGRPVAPALVVAACVAASIFVGWKIYSFNRAKWSAEGHQLKIVMPQGFRNLSSVTDPREREGVPDAVIRWAAASGVSVYGYDPAGPAVFQGTVNREGEGVSDHLALLREVGPDVADSVVAVSVVGVSVLAVAERTSG